LASWSIGHENETAQVIGDSLNIESAALTVAGKIRPNITNKSQTWHLNWAQPAINYPNTQYIHSLIH
jgi:hypothetical protein